MNDPRLALVAEACSALLAAASPDGQLLSLNRAGRELIAAGRELPFPLADALDEASRRALAGLALPAALAGQIWEGELALAGSGRRISTKIRQIGAGKEALLAIEGRPIDPLVARHQALLAAMPDRLIEIDAERRISAVH
jgi:PAS domain-containing protein